MRRAWLCKAREQRLIRRRGVCKTLGQEGAWRETEQPGAAGAGRQEREVRADLEGVEGATARPQPEVWKFLEVEWKVPDEVSA